MKKNARSCIAILIICILALNFSACKELNHDTDKSMLVQARVIEIEKYGHAVLDVTTAELIAVGYELGDVVCVRLGTCESTMPFFDGYYSNPQSLLLRGSASEDYVAVCINYGDFSDANDVSVGDTAEITMSEKAGMRAIQEL